MAEKLFHKIQHPFLIKNSEKQDMHINNEYVDTKIKNTLPFIVA